LTILNIVQHSKISSETLPDVDFAT